MIIVCCVNGTRMKLIYFVKTRIKTDFLFFRFKFLLKTIALALMGTASFCGGVRHKRYSGQQETAPENSHNLLV